MTQDDKKPEQTISPIAPCSPPSHPTTLGQVWIGMTRPSVTAIAPAHVSGPPTAHLEQSRND